MVEINGSSQVSAGQSAPRADEVTELLGRCGRGDEAAFASLYEQVAARVYGLALRVVRDPAQAEEVAQEALVELWRTAARFDPQRGRRSPGSSP